MCKMAESQEDIALFHIFLKFSVVNLEDTGSCKYIMHRNTLPFHYVDILYLSFHVAIIHRSVDFLLFLSLLNFVSH